MITYQPYPPIGALTTPPPVKRSVVDLMADRLLELGMNGIAVTADELFSHSSFTRAEIAEHGQEAADLARSRAVRQVS
ncbi:MAG: hypothetical protein J0I92_06455 [Phyllobacterium sp.]|nr:hypothetical protein [Phyllobacterium sp.]ODT12455.1 MAG: hypothetical protein ABS57_21915 [Mesorhizobium sp. SCN 65-12]